MKKRPLTERFWPKVERGSADECWLWSGSTEGKGYGSLTRREGGTTKAHRISWELHFGPIPAGLMVCHKCDTPRCVNPDHLFLGTNRDNILDAVSKGRVQPPRSRGEANGAAKLTSAQAEAIRNDNGTQREIGARYGVSHSAIGLIKRGQTRVTC